MTFNRLLLLPTTILPLFATGCMGTSGGKINFNDLKYPASMSQSLYGPNGDVVQQGGGLQLVREFKYTMDYWSIFYSIIPLSCSRDIINQMNRDIDEAGGDGIINVEFTSDYSKLNSVVILNLLPIWPGCNTVSVSGNIVKLMAP